MKTLSAPTAGTRRRHPRLLLLLVFVVASLFAAACGSGGDTAEPSGDVSEADAGDATEGDSEAAAEGERQVGGELIHAFPSQEAGDLAALDPQIGEVSTYANSILNSIYDPLVYQDPETNELVGGLAESWEVSEDGMTWTITLKEGPTFHDGSPVTSEDVQYMFERAADEQYLPGNAYVSTLVANVEGTEIVDERTLKVNMSRPQANFVQSTLGRSYYGVVPKAIVEEVGVEEFGKNPVGTGPFKFVEWVPEGHILLERNPDYTWGPNFTETAGDPPDLENLRFVYIEDPQTRIAAFMAGEVTSMDGIPEADQARLEGDSEVTILKTGKNGSPGMLYFNTANAPTDDPAVRRAIGHAIDREALNTAVFSGVHEAVCTFLEPRMLFVNEEACSPEHDPDAARQLLDEAGWTEGSDGVREKDGEKLEITGLVYSENARRLEFLQAQLAEVGISLVVEPGQRSSIDERQLQESGWHVVHGNPQGWTNEDPNILRAQYHSSLISPDGTSNVSRYDNPEVDELLDAGLAEMDPAAREEIYMEIQEILAEDLPAVTLVSMQRNLAHRNNVHGIIPDVRGTYRYFHDVWIEE